VSGSFVAFGGLALALTGKPRRLDRWRRWLNLKWLQAWSYYWPNFYDVAAIVDTWRSVATILEADICPG